MGNVKSESGHIHLERAPLARVLTQVRFPNQALRFEQDKNDIVRTFTEHLTDFPVVRELPKQQVTIGENTIKVEPHRWLLQSVDGDWTITVCESFVGLATTNYSGGHHEFVKRFSELITATADILHPPVCDRLGVRYTNIVVDSTDFKDISDLVEPALVGGRDLGSSAIKFKRSISEALYQTDDGTQLAARWGILGPNEGFDPTLPVPTSDHWLLDVDVFTDSPTRFDSDDLTRRCDEFANLEHDFFRSCVNEKFIEHFGGSNDS